VLLKLAVFCWPEISYARSIDGVLSHVIFRFAHFRVVQACSLLLKQFEKNLPHTNHCIAKMLHRIAWDCKLPSMLFQASMFRTFQRILDSKLEKDKVSVELQADPMSTGNTFQDLPRLRETADNNERYI
jgi:hypothetical protein